MKTATPWIISVILASVLVITNLPKEIQPEELSNDFDDFYAIPREKLYEIYAHKDFQILKSKTTNIIALSTKGRLFGMIESNGGSIQLLRDGRVEVWFPGPDAKPNSILVYTEGMDQRRWELVLPKDNVPRIEEIYESGKNSTVEQAP